MFKGLSFITNIFGAGHGSSFLAANYVWTVIKNAWSWLLDKIISVIWIVCKFILGVMEAFEYMIKEFLGIGTDFDDVQEFAGNLKMGDGTYYLDFLIKVLRAVIGASLVLIIVFTIIALIKQEWDNANSGFEEPKKKGVGNNKSGIMMRMFKNILAIFALPLTMILIFMGINSILTSFNEALNVSNATIAGQVLGTSTYDANKYRTYAKANQRIPITISAYENTTDADRLTELSYVIKSASVQSKLQTTASDMVNGTGLSFKDSLVYKNNKFYNSTAYADYYENFVCTPEQYQVMADFVDYMQSSGGNYYIKSMDEVDIEWKYVENVIYDGTALNISYRDASDFDEDGDDADTYTMSFAPSAEVTTPISDALDSIMAMLGVGEYGDNVYKTMERDDSGDYVNLVEWANEKALIHFSDSFQMSNTGTWTDTDEIIVYEFYHFPSNNTFGNYSLSDFEMSEDGTGGVELDVYELVYRDYYASADAYSPEKYIYCVYINGNYYKVEKSEKLTDSYGNPYYELLSLNGGSIANKNVHFMDPSYQMLTTTTDTVTLRLSSGFNINNPCNYDSDGNITSMNWSLAEQIIVYEYYKDLTVGNDLSKYSFADFYSNTSVNTKNTNVTLPVYKITDKKANLNTETAIVESYTTTEGYYVLINGTYYKLTGSSGSYSLPSGSNYLDNPTYANSTYYNYTVLVNADGSNGFNSASLQNAEKFLYSTGGTFVEIKADDANFAKYEDFTLELSLNFNYSDITTWSYRDYFLFYLYTRYGIASSIDSMKYVGVQGKIGTINGTYVFKTDLNNGTNVYIKIDEARNISEFNMYNTLDVLDTLENNDTGTIDNNLFVSFDETSDKILTKEITSEILYFSDEYDFYDVSSWTVLDFILTYFSQAEIINPIETIESDGYQSFVYTIEEVTNGTKTVSDKLYRFGKTGGINTYYLSEYNVLHSLVTKTTGLTVSQQLVYNSLQQWFNRSFYDFVCDINSFNSSDLVNTYTELTENMFSNYESYIYSYDNLVDDLVNDDYGTSAVRNLTKYTYTNPSFSRLNLTTWTQFDLLLYCVTGSATGTFSAPVVTTGTNEYLQITEDKYVLISSGIFKMTLGGSATITSKEASIGSGKTVTYYVEHSLSSYVKRSEDFSTSLIKAFMTPFKYTSGSKDLTPTTTYSSGTVYDLDTLIAYYNGNLSKNTTFNFDIYYDSTSKMYYIQISDDAYVSVSTASSYNFKYNNNLTLTITGEGKNKQFTEKTTYNAFSLYEGTETGKTVQYKTLDTYIYSITGSIEPKEYKVYQFGGDSKNYLILEHNGKMYAIDYISSEASTVNSVPTTVTGEDYLTLLNYLYETYYEQYCSESVSNVVIDDSYNSTVVESGTTTAVQGSFITSFDVTNMTTWSPMNIILYTQGIISSENDAYRVTFELYKNTDGTKNYFKIDLSSDGSGKTLYINYTDLCSVASTTATGAYVEFINTIDAVIKMNMNAFIVVDPTCTAKQTDAEGAVYNPTSVLAERLNFISHYTTKFSIVEKSTVQTTVASTMDISNPETWTWLDLLYYYHNGVIRTADDNKFLAYVSLSSAGAHDQYFVLGTGDLLYNMYLYKAAGSSTSALTAKFTKSATKTTISYTIDSYSTLDLIYYKLTGDNSEDIYAYNFKDSSGATKSFYYIQSAYNLEYYGTMDISSTSESLEVFTVDGFKSAGSTAVAKDYTVTVLSIDELTRWTTMDYIVHYAVGSVETATYIANVYRFGSSIYLEINEMYINITLASIYVDFSVANTSATSISAKSGDELIDQVGIAEASEQAADRWDHVLIKKDNLMTSGVSNEKDIINGIDADKIETGDTLKTYMFSFSGGFDASDFTTWTVADFILYYIFDSEFYTAYADNKFNMTVTQQVLVDGEFVDKTTTYTYSTLNFQTFINNGGAVGYIYHMQKEDGFGSTKAYKVINFGNSNYASQGIYINYDVFMELYNRKLVYAGTTETLVSDGTNDVPVISLSLGATGVYDITSSNAIQFYHRVAPTTKVIDFTYDNYYFFEINTEEFAKYETGTGVSQDLITAVDNGDAVISGTINLKLSEGFNISNPNTWTLLDYIVIYEFQRGSMSLNFSTTSATANLFYGMKFNELKTANNYVSLYSLSGDIRVLSVNGNFYNLTEYLTQKDPTTVNFVTYLIEKIADAGENLTSTLKTALSDYTHVANTFGEYLNSQLNSYSNPASKAGYALLNKLRQICTDYISLDSSLTDEDSIEFAEYMLITLNQNSANEDITISEISEILSSRLENFKEDLIKTSEYVINSSMTSVNSHSRMTNKIDENGNIVYDESTGEPEQVSVTISGVVTNGNVGSYDIKVLVESVGFAIENSTTKTITKTLGVGSNSISYVSSEDPNVRYYKGIYYNTQAQYQISLTSFAKYTLSLSVKEVSWPEKLMNDMQVLYPDLNWGTLIATDGWLDTLGDFTSAYTNGMYVTEGNSSNTTAAGLVLSEFFLSVSSKETSAYAKYSYSSLFDEDIIKSLMLSIMGEENYRTLELQAEVFMDMFNTSFASILDDIAEDNQIEIADGQVDNFTMCVYKSYLATVLLSSDLGEYLYTVATRVYAQYTIYESLACASGDYASYYAYVNDYLDENGETADSFTFATFYELVKYENKLCGSSTPTFTFNMYNAYVEYQNERGQTAMTRSAFASQSDFEYLTWFNKLKAYIQSYYNNIYESGGTVLDNDKKYCFLYEAYFDIYYTCLNRGDDAPYYLEIYKSYLDGEIERWSILKGDCITDTVSYMSKYNNYQSARTMSKMSAISELINNYGMQLSFNEETGETEITSISDIIQLIIPLKVLNDSLGSKFDSHIDNVFIYGSSMNTYEYLALLALFNSSESGNSANWNKIKTMKESLQVIIAELNEVLELSPETNPANTRTESGSKKCYDEYVYQDTIDSLNNLYVALSDYITSQQIIDQITKASITFTLAQYGQNYVPDGFTFTLEGKDYTFNSELSSGRLAEYVYGGSYLSNFGVEPLYTSDEFNGIVSQTKVYDSSEGAMKIKLGMWTELRGFASELANYTAKLYYTTNLTDLAANVTDGIKMTDYIYADVQGSKAITSANGYVMKTTLEYEILQYIIDEEDISATTLLRLIYGDSSTKISSLLNNATSDVMVRIDSASVVNLAKFIEGDTSISMTEEAKKAAIKDYLIFVQSSDYTSGYYNIDGNIEQNERIHMAFKNVITYLLVSEEQAEDEEASAIVLDDITFKEFKLTLMDKLVDYEENPGETGTENASRYLTIFNLITAQFTYHGLDFVGGNMSIGKAVGTTMKPIDLDVYDSGSSTDANLIARNGVLIYSAASSDTYLYGSFGTDTSTRHIILKMASLENRPIEELVNLEYDSLYDRNGCYDEAMGDVFIVCTMDEITGKYIPVLARGKNVKLGWFSDGSDYSNYVNDYGINLQTSYYDSDAANVNAQSPLYYPIIAKGIISASGHPTAIRIQDGELQYYRTDITATSSVDPDAVSATASVSEVTTVGYTDFVESSSHKGVSGSNQKTMFIGSYDIKTYVNSGSAVFYLQDEVAYVLPPTDDYGGISVLDQFSAYYLMAGQTYMLLLIGLSTMLPILFNATAAAIRRILDLIFLTIIGPFVISMTSLDSKDGNKKSAGGKAFEQWKTNVEKTLLSAFGYVISFNIYYILSTTVLQMEFVSDLTYTNITRVGGLGFVSKNLLESILKYVYIVGAASVVKGGAGMLLSLITAGKMANPFAPAVGSTSKGQEPEVMESVKGIVTEVQTGIEKLEGVVTGQALLDAKNALGEGAKKFVPGSAVAEAAVEKGKDIHAKNEAQKNSMMAQMQGVPKAQADKASKELYENEKKSRQLEKQKKVQSANNFMAQYGGAFNSKK